MDNNTSKSILTNRTPLEKQWWRSITFGITVLTLITAALTVAVITRPLTTSESIGDRTNFFLRTSLISPGYTTTTTPTPLTSNPIVLEHQLSTIVHYATSQIIPQQSRDEIAISYAVLRAKAPCNFLVYGLGYDSQMWVSLNPGGVTLFLEEDAGWVQDMLKDAPYMNARAVKYRTQLLEADQLLHEYKNVSQCWPSTAYLRDNERCRLALHNLPPEVYDRQWDLIMIDAPRGYFDKAPGRMGAIYSAAVMARQRKDEGPTHVFLHDVDRPVEKQYAEEFLCKKNLVDAAGRLWHFAIPPPPAGNTSSGHSFC